MLANAHPGIVGLSIINSESFPLGRMAGLYRRSGYTNLDGGGDANGAVPLKTLRMRMIAAI